MPPAALASRARCGCPPLAGCPSSPAAARVSAPWGIASAGPAAQHPPMNATAPLPVSERIAVLDILRGFALMGILIMNMPGFSSSFFAEADGSHLWPGRLDQLAGELRDMLFSGKFNSMFSLLFGIGFTIQLGRMEERQQVIVWGIHNRVAFFFGQRFVMERFVRQRHVGHRFLNK